MAEGGAHHQSDQLQLAVQEAIGAFAEAHAAFERLESTHDRTEYEQVAERLRILGETLSNVRREALTYRLHVAQRRTHR
jgi:hypothetical protein